MIAKIESLVRKWEWAGLVEEISILKEYTGASGPFGTSVHFDEEGVMQIEVTPYGRKATTVTVEFEKPDTLDKIGEIKPPVSVRATQVADREIPAAVTELHRTVEVTTEGITASGDLGRHALLGALRLASSQLAGSPEMMTFDLLSQYGQSETQVD